MEAASRRFPAECGKFPHLRWFGFTVRILARTLYIGGMAKQPRKHRDRYDVTGNVEAEYVDDARTVLINKQGITDLAILQLREEDALAEAYETLLGEVRLRENSWSSTRFARGMRGRSNC